MTRRKMCQPFRFLKIDAIAMGVRWCGGHEAAFATLASVETWIANRRGIHDLIHGLDSRMHGEWNREIIYEAH